MPVHKSLAVLLAADGATVGEGRAYVHLRESYRVPQDAQGTISLDWWDDDAAAPTYLRLQDGPRLPVRVQGDRLSECMVGRIVRYTLRWPGTRAPSEAG